MLHSMSLCPSEIYMPGHDPNLPSKNRLPLSLVNVTNIPISPITMAGGTEDEDSLTPCQPYICQSSTRQTYFI